MSKENVIVELVAPAGKGAYTDVGAKRMVQVNLGDGTVAIDGVTYTRTSPLRSQKADANDQIPYPTTADGNAWQKPVDASAGISDTALAIFSQSGT